MLRRVRAPCVTFFLGLLFTPPHSRGNDDEKKMHLDYYVEYYGGDLYFLAFAEHAVARRKVPKAVIEAAGCFHEECRTLDLQRAPSA